MSFGAHFQSSLLDVVSASVVRVVSYSRPSLGQLRGLKVPDPRSYIKRCQEGTTQQELKPMTQKEKLLLAFHDETSSLATFCTWFNQFKRGRTNLTDDLPEERPSMATAENNFSAVQLMKETAKRDLSADLDQLRHRNESNTNLSRSPEGFASRSERLSLFPAPHASDGTYRSPRKCAERPGFWRGHRRNRSLRHLGRHFNFPEDPIRLLHPGKEAFGDFTRASLVCCRLLGEGGPPAELVHTFVTHDSGMRSNPELAHSPAFRNSYGDVAPSFVSQRMIGSRAGQYLQGRPGVTENIDQPVLTFLHPPYRSLQLNYLRLVNRAEGIKPERRVPDLLSVPPFRQGRTDFALYSASVGVDLRPDHCKTVHCLEVEVLDALVPDLGHVRRVRQVTEIHGHLELPVDKSVP
ncbi:hypothetical protein EVAR_85296_1 [Eumeta japonica]|uniref:Mos1 transposase HTH domain-containing protein n=1 Tax=Eumeta variegata TaxID=151549 RepID=A0A4C1V7X0_EUMVA|nr:hypothetical protein EVAR_85296_1 [Eumeta japonica]